LMDGRAQPTGIRTHGRDSTLLMVLNSYHDVVEFTLPKSPEGLNWLLLCDTNQPEAKRGDEFQFGTACAATGRSLLLFLLKPSAVN
jgi:isoamylase